MDRSALTHPRLWQGIGWLMMVIVIWLSLTPAPPEAPKLLKWDKLQHLLAYAGLMYWFGMAFHRHWRWPLLLIGLGVGLEFLQGLGGIRTMDPFDMISNSLGVGIGALMIRTRLGQLLSKIDTSLTGLRHRATS